MVPRNIKILFLISLILVVILIWKWYWKIQLMYNFQILSSMTPDEFVIPENLKEKYKNAVQNGFKIAKTKKVIFAALLRDVETRLPEIEKKVERTGQMFKDYKVFIVENDSSDQTRMMLLKWVKKNPKVTILGCGYNVDACSIPSATNKTDGHSVDSTRIQKMVNLRNIYLDEIKKRTARGEIDDFDYAIFWDLDMIASVYFDGIAHSIDYFSKSETIDELDAVCAYGIYRWTPFLTLFYDTYALVHQQEKFHINLKTIHDIRKGLWEVKYDRGEDPVKVDSCFSGFTIYRLDALLPEDVRYDMSDNTNLECEHSRLNMKLKGKKVMNPSMIHLVLENS